MGHRAQSVHLSVSWSVVGLSYFLKGRRKVTHPCSYLSTCSYHCLSVPFYRRTSWCHRCRGVLFSFILLFFLVESEFSFFNFLSVINSQLWLSPFYMKDRRMSCPTYPLHDGPKNFCAQHISTLKGFQSDMCWLYVVILYIIWTVLCRFSPLLRREMDNSCFWSSMKREEMHNYK